MTIIREVDFTKTDTEAQAAIVEVLEKWLERAKNGEITAIAIAAARSDGGQTTQYDSGVRSRLVLQSAVTTLLFRLGNQIANGD